MSNIKLVYDAFGRPHPVKEEEMFEYGLDIDGQPAGGTAVPTGLEFRLLGTVTCDDLRNGLHGFPVGADEVLISAVKDITESFDQYDPMLTNIVPGFANGVETYTYDTGGTKSWAVDTYYGQNAFLDAGGAIWEAEQTANSGPLFLDNEHTQIATGPGNLGALSINQAGTGYAASSYAFTGGAVGKYGAMIYISSVNETGGITGGEVVFGGNGYMQGYGLMATVAGGDDNAVVVISCSNPISDATADTLSIFAAAHQVFTNTTASGTAGVGDGGVTWLWRGPSNTTGAANIYGLVATKP